MRPDQPASPPPGRTATRGRRWGVRLAGAVSLCVLAAAGAGWGVMHGIGDAIGRIDVFNGLRGRPSDDGSQTFLLVGTDDRDGVAPQTLKRLHAGGESCNCTDTMMLIHLSRDRSRASVISIPRDSYVAIPAHTDPVTRRAVPAGKGKINAAYGMGGPPLTVQTVEQATGIRVDHYLQVDFLSFVGTVDALGGVEVCTSVPLHDSFSGLDLPAGSTRLDGARALQYVRARHVDASADIGRMQRQQKFMAQLIQQSTSGRTLLDPIRLGRVVGSALKAVKADRGLSAEDLVDLAVRMRGFSPANADFATVPTADVDHTVPGWGSTVLWDDAKAKALFTAVRDDRPVAPHRALPRSSGHSQNAAGSALTVPPAQVRIQVLNGAGIAGLGAKVDTDLQRMGFATTGLASNAPGAGTTRTAIRYDPRWDESVKTIAAALPGALLVQQPGLGPTMQVVAGSDYRGPAPVVVTSPDALATPGADLFATPGDAVICP